MDRAAPGPPAWLRGRSGCGSMRWRRGKRKKAMPDSVPRSSRPWRWLVGGLTVLIFALVLFIGSRWNSGGKDRSSLPVPGPLLVLRPVTLVPGIHLLGRLTPAVAYVVETSA